jgi:hypothetical protein
MMCHDPAEDRDIKGWELPWQFPPHSRTGSTPRRVGQAVYWLSPGSLCALRAKVFLAGADTDVSKSRTTSNTAMLGVPI